MRRPSMRPAAQLSLFQPPPTEVCWETLPKEIQQQSLQLLSRLLRQHCARHRASAQAREAGDE